MLSGFIIDSLDMVNIIYLWVILTQKSNNVFKLLSSILIASISTVFIEKLELNFIVVHVMIILVLKIIYKINLKEIIMGFFLVLIIVMSFQLIFSLLINNFVYDNTYREIIIESIILIGIIIFSKINSVGKKFSIEKMNRNVVIYFLSTFSIYAIVLKGIWNYDTEIILNNLFIIAVIFSILVISQILLYLYIIKVIKKEEKIKISNEYNAAINEIVQEIKQRQHDFVNYKNTIKGMVAVLEEKDLKKAIKNYIKDEDTYDNKVNELVYIDNIVIRSVIYRNMCKAKRYNVNFQYKIENNVLDHILSYHDISNILNNLLNNSFDEVLKDECTKRNIEIKILNQNKTSHLIAKNQIVNPNSVNLSEMFIRGYSTKSTDTRGYGLYNVQQIVNLHKGYIKINVEGEDIIFDIYFNNSSG